VAAYRIDSPSAATTEIAAMSLVRALDVVMERADMHPPPSERPPASTLSPTPPPAAGTGWPSPSEGAQLTLDRGRALSALSLVLTLGVVLGALLGALLGVVQGRQPSAAALLQLTPPSSPALTVLDGGPPPSDTATNYVAGELAYLSSSAARQALQQRLGLDSAPGFTAAQESTSSVVRLSAEAGTEDAAVRIVQSVIDLYVQRRAAQAQQRTQAALATVDAALGPLTAEAEAVDDPAVQALVDRLQNLRLDVQLQSGRDAAVEVVQAPSADPDTGAPLWVLGAALGACCGGLLATGAFLLRRTWSPRLWDVADLAGIAGRVLLPEVRLKRGWVQRLAGTDRQLARLLLAQVLGQCPPAGRTIVVTGASGASGTEAIAALIAVGAAEHGPTLLVRVGARARPHPLAIAPVAIGRDGVDVRGTGHDRLWTVDVARNGHPVTLDGAAMTVAVGTAGAAEPCVIVDAGSVTGSPAALESLRQAGDVVLVVRLGVDARSEAAAVTAAAGGDAGRVSAVVTTTGWWSGARSRLAAPGG